MEAPPDGEFLNFFEQPMEAPRWETRGPGDAAPPGGEFDFSGSKNNVYGTEGAVYTPCVLNYLLFWVFVL
jgi:hypothetical protein